jgi:biopolymer transport protein ExbB/TolQ
MHQLPIALSVEDILFDVAEALRVPVLVLALAAGVVVLIEVGALLMELRRRRKRGIARLDKAIDEARAALAIGDRDGAVRIVRALGYNRAMSDALAAVVEQRGRPDSGDRIAKRMAEYDYRSLRRLERTRILVRAGPALGLMGTLIPLSPALKALADGNVNTLTEELRVAFSVTVAGLLIGMVAFAVSLVRDRLYAQDFSDVEYVAAELERDLPVQNAAPVAAHAPVAQQVASVAQPQPAAPQQAAPPAQAAPVVPAQATPQPEAPTQVVTPSATEHVATPETPARPEGQ